MKIQFLCPRWGAEKIGWLQFLTKVKQAGYSGIEWFPYGEPLDRKLVLDLLEQLKLEFSIVMAVTNPYQGFDDYTNNLFEQLTELATIGSQYKKPLFISAQTGREFFTREQTLRCLDICNTVEDNTGIPIYQETHRNKWSYGAHTVFPVLRDHPTLKLTLDVSHWFCVSESYLEELQDAVSLAIMHTRHIHARIGYLEGVQVFDPALSEYADALNAHLKIWDAWVQYQQSLGKQEITITTEFGPQPYLTSANRSIDLFAEQWRLNLWMKTLLEKRYNKRTQ